jgi:hypothetical protein
MLNKQRRKSMKLPLKKVDHSMRISQVEGNGPGYNRYTLPALQRLAHKYQKEQDFTKPVMEMMFRDIAQNLLAHQADSFDYSYLVELMLKGIEADWSTSGSTTSVPYQRFCEFLFDPTESNIFKNLLTKEAFKEITKSS